MYGSQHNLWHKIWWSIVCISVTCICLIIFAFVILSATTVAGPAATAPNQDQTYADVSETSEVYAGSNVVTNGLDAATIELGQTATNIEQTILMRSRSFAVGVTSGLDATLKGVQSGASFVGSSLRTGAGYVARIVATGCMYAASMPRSVFGHVFGYAADNVVVGSVLKPTGGADMAAPKIDPSLPVAISSFTTLSPASVQAPSTAAPSTKPSIAWPMTGDLTTLFGVPHWPYQPLHTGLDISDGKPSGVTPIKPFKPGRVIDTVYSYSGLGNTVILDHGNGMTTVYAHLSSISVQIGQAVDHTTVLGLQGSTGASTGPHLHFEIRLHGEPVNPLPYLKGEAGIH